MKSYRYVISINADKYIYKIAKQEREVVDFWKQILLNNQSLAQLPVLQLDKFFQRKLKEREKWLQQMLEFLITGQMIAEEDYALTKEFLNINSTYEVYQSMIQDRNEIMHHSTQMMKQMSVFQAQYQQSCAEN